MRWPEQQRMIFIREHLTEHGWIGRKPIMDKFGVSVPQASNDLRKFQKLHPDAVVYDTSAKRYETALCGCCWEPMEHHSPGCSLANHSN